MTAESAGVLLYRHVGPSLEVLLGHPGGPFWARRDAGAWAIPKGGIDIGETPEAAARREFAEEMGTVLDLVLQPLAVIRQGGGKRVHAFAAESDFDAASQSSNAFEMEWPPRSGQVQRYPEVDRAAWFSIDDARTMILPSQTPLLDALEDLLGTGHALRPHRPGDAGTGRGAGA